MGVLNVTLDSFSDGGKFLNVINALNHARQMAFAGADMIDIGGESTRPGAEPVTEQEEMRRVLPLIEQLHTEFTGKERAPLISIDTSKAAVAEAAVAAGAQIVNDVTGARDSEMRKVVKKTGAALVIMHMQGTPRDMQRAPHYENVVGEIRQFFQDRLATCVADGLEPETICFDPGIGFGKTVAHNLTLLKNLASLRVDGRPLLVGVSKKSFIGKVLGSQAIEERCWPTVALTSLARERGANIVRVHDVRENAQALRMTEAILNGGITA
ncbi:MAG: dihydropteroate synthase [Chthoniobacteraceae bacterium]